MFIPSNDPSLWISSVSVSIFLSTSLLAGSFIVSMEAPGVESTTSTGNFIVENFDSVQAGYYTKLVRPIGTYNIDSSAYPGAGIPGVNPADPGGFQVKSADQYGGSGGQGNYVVNVRPLSNNGGIRLSFGSDQNYFGFYWSAGTPDTVIFSDKGTVVFSYAIQNVSGFINTLPNRSSYFGNPDQPFRGSDSPEPFAYLNFYAPKNQPFDSVYFKGDLMETDNHTILAASSPSLSPSGTIVPTAVPEPPETAFITGALLGAIALVRHRLKK